MQIAELTNYGFLVNNPNVAMVPFNWLQLQVRGGNVDSLHYNMLCAFFSPFGKPAGHDSESVADSSIQHLNLTFKIMT